MNETTPHRFICLSAWFLVGRTVLGRTKMCGLLGGGVSLEVEFEVKKITQVDSLSLCLSLCLSISFSSLPVAWD